MLTSSPQAQGGTGIRRLLAAARSNLLYGSVVGLLLALCLWAGLGGPIGARTLHLPLPGILAVSVPAGGTLLLFGAIAMAALAVFLLLPHHRSTMAAAGHILLLSLVCRLAILPQPPSDDVNRYLWESRLLNQGISPYRWAPEDPTLAPLAAGDPYHAAVNHPDLAAAYPPLVIVLFAAAGRIAYHPMAVKLLAVIFDMATVALLLQLLADRALALRWALLYAINPLILYSFAGQGHFDALQACLLCGAMAAHRRRRWPLMFLLLGLAVQVKYVAAVTVPLFVRSDNRRHAVWAAVAALGPLVPFVLTDGTAVFNSLMRFSGHYAFNGPVHGLLQAALGGIPPATTACRILLAVWIVGTWAACRSGRPRPEGDDPAAGCLAALGGVILLSPTVHVWYLAWVLPFTVLRPTASWLVLSLTAGVAFMADGYQTTTGRWHLPAGIQMVEWLPFALLLLREARLAAVRRRHRLPPQPADTLSVVIPALNEAAGITTCVRAVQSDPAVSEVIVVDGGSTDATARLAAAAGAMVVRCDAPPEAGGGRGGQLHRGVALAGGDVVALVHADTRVGAPCFSRMLAVLNGQPSIVGGAAGSRFDARHCGYRLLEMANDFRMALMGIGFGDQVQFFRRHLLIAAVGFPAIPLMEDVELSLRLKRLGRQTCLFEPALVSPRSWRSRGAIRVSVVLRLCAAYLWGRLWGTPDTVSMYRRYYSARSGSR